MSRFKCTKELYQGFLQASSVRYSGYTLIKKYTGETPVFFNLYLLRQ